MKKNVLLGLAVLGTVSMLCGFDSAETADSVLQKMNDASADIKTMTADMDINLDAALNVADDSTNSTLAVSAKGGFNVAYSMDPVAMKMDGKLNLSALGQGQDMEMQMYGVTDEDGALETYTFAKENADDEGTWSYSKDDTFDMNELMEMSKTMSTGDLSEWGLTFELAPEAADVNGTECYQLTAVVDSDSLNTMINKVSEMAGQDLANNEEISLAMSYMEGIKMNMVYYVDTATYLPVSCHIDLNDSDLTTLNSLLATTLGGAEDGTSISLTLNDFSIDMATSYGDAVEVTVPQEALDAVASGAAQSLDNMVEDLEEAAETEMGA